MRKTENSTTWITQNLTKFDHPLLDNIRKDKHTFCNGRFISHNGYFAVLTHVVIDKNQSTSQRRGGENVSEVLNRNKENEFIKTTYGFFKVFCESKPVKTFSPSSGHLKEWEESLEFLELSSDIPSVRTEDMVTFAIVRYDYANLYWVMVDLYDIYFLTTFLGLNPNNIHILIVDAHPVSIPDDIWWILFPKVTRIGQASNTVMFKTLVWGLHRGNSPLLKNGDFNMFPLLEEFKHFVLSKTDPLQNLSDINCNNVTVTIVLRRNYVAHARNPSGRVGRKIFNEQELLKNVSKALKGHTVTGIQLDLLPIDKQIRLASRTDILVGMHGAGLSHVLFVPIHACLIELFPITHSTLSHFEFIARWRKIKYAKWQNKDKSMEIDQDTTKVDTEKVAALVLNAYHQMCP
ncbi:uncharacterized protein LOC123550584 [Mercenaria mercenaria]|uniref:uncharacterized protein LOC123550584 n=1 Tax=Mercenaria mercenaria TaxID=6596 RepID=UPI001E1DCD16|nr:uncharacterized protein LOC123550584 [Mercenaria mercenaria]